MMEIIGDDPVLWVDVKTLKERGPYASENMRPVQHGAGRRPTPATRRCGCSTGRRWSTDEWFVDDGIHYNADGYAYRAALIADAVAEAFPAGES